MANPADNRYWAQIDTTLENNSHTQALDLIGSGKRVLELGPAAGHVTRSLVSSHCTVVGIELDPEAAAGLEGIAECIVGDVSDPSVIRKAGEAGPFDAVLAGDVLEHLPDPGITLRAAREVLVPGGYLVISLPNVGHADVALSLVQGRFPYGQWGLLDRTHLRFFTLDTLHELLEEAGFVAIDVRRVLVPVFETELGVDPAQVPAEVVEAVLRNSEAETYQFVVRAVPHTGDHEVERLAARCLEADEVARQERVGRIAAAAQLEAAVTLVTELRAQAESWRREAADHAVHIEALNATKTMRLAAPFRRIYARLLRLAT